MKTENRPGRMEVFSNPGNAGFTFIELIMVIVLIGILTSIAAQKMIRAAEQAEITAEAMTIDVMRSNLINNFGNRLLQGLAAQFPPDPFVNLNKVPEGYDRRRNTRPTGQDIDASTWVFVQGGAGGLTQEEAGTTITNFLPVGFIYHQRKDGTVIKWPYDSNNGIIGKKQIDITSQIKTNTELNKQQRGEPTERQRLNNTL